MCKMRDEKTIRTIEAWLAAYRAGRKCKTLGERAINAIRQAQRNTERLERRVAASLSAARRRGTSLPRLARDIGLTPSALYGVADGSHSLSPRLGERLLRVLNKERKR